MDEYTAIEKLPLELLQQHELGSIRHEALVAVVFGWKFPLSLVRNATDSAERSFILFNGKEGNWRATSDLFFVKEKPMAIIHKMRLPIALILIGMGAMGSPAHASNWSMNGSSCVPNDTATNQYLVTGGSVTHRTYSLSRLIFYCPITNTWGSYKPTRLRMTYMNNRPLDELRREDAHITAQVIRLVASNGTLTTISGVLHNERDPELVGRRIEIPLNPHNFDFKNSYYYVRVDITRKSAAGFAKLFGVSLDCATCPAN